MSVAHVQTVKSVDNDNTTSAVSASLTCTAGNLLICTVVEFDAGTAPTVTGTLDGGSAFTVDKTAVTGNERVTFLSFHNVSAGSHACHLTFSVGCDYVTIFLTEVSGAKTVASQDGVGGSGAGTGTAVSSGSFTTSATSFVVSAFVTGTAANPATVTAGSGWTIPTNGSETNGSANVVGGFEYKANPGTSSHTGDFTSSTADWVAIGFAYLELGATLPVVPGGFGYGMQTRAAYGHVSLSPVILRVTNLNDSGAGSLRAALESTVPRVIIFEVSGTITCLTYLNITSPYFTVAGQTAPAPGIALQWVGGYPSDQGFFISTHDGLVQHLPIRPGVSCNSALGVLGNVGGAYNVVIDHCSVSWGQDENLYFYYPNTYDCTVWRCISSEGLFQTPGSSGCAGGGTANGHGCLIAAGPQNISILQTLFAHCLERTPQQQSPCSTYIANNVLYNAHEGMFYEGVSGNVLASSIGNYIKRGPTARADVFGMARDMVAGDEVYFSDNTIDDGGLTPAISPWTLIAGADPRVGSAPLAAPSGYTPLSSAATYAHVLAVCGARPASRDAVDARIIADVQNRTGDIISNPTQVGGYPTLAQNTRALTTPSSPHVVQASGYTALEEWLHGYADGVEGVVAGGTISLVSGQTMGSLGDHFVTDGISGGASLLAPAGNGNLVVVTVYGDDGAGTGNVTSVVDDNGAYTLGRAQQNDIVGLFVEIWYRVMTSGTGGGQNIIVTVDAAFSSANNIIAAMEFTGTLTLQESLAANGANTGPSTTHASGTVIPGATENVVVALAAGSDRAWTQDIDNWMALTGTPRVVSSYKIQTENLAQEYNATQDVAGYAASVLVAFKGGGGGGGGGGVVTPRGMLLGIFP